MPSIADHWAAGDRESYRVEFIRRAQEAARVSLGYLAPRDEGEVPTGDDYPRLFSGRGARGTVNLASKLRTGTFPVTHPFFQYEPDLSAFLKEGVRIEDKAELIVALSRRERAVQAFLDRGGWGARAFLMFEHLILSGNYLLQQLPSGRFIGYRLDMFQVERDGTDLPRAIMIRQFLPKTALPEEMRDKAPDAPGRKDHTIVLTRAEVTHEDFKDPTGEKRMWAMWQELGDGTPLGDVEENIKGTMLPLVPVRMFQSDDHYGRSLFDVIQGEIESLEGLTQSIVEDAAMAVNGFWQIDPASGVDISDFLSKSSGDGVYAKEGQISMVRTGKGADMQFGMGVRDMIDRELAAVFLSFLPRDSERTTAEEIRRVTQELNESFGGAFSLWATEMQLPVARLTASRMVALGKLPKVRSKNRLFEPRIVTGIDSIGRGRDLVAIDQLVSMMQQGIGPEATAMRLKEDLWHLAAGSLGLDPEAVLKTEDQLQEEAAQQAETEGINNNMGEIMRMAQSLEGGTEQ
jgi:hypothetical protein